MSNSDLSNFEPDDQTPPKDSSWLRFILVSVTISLPTACFLIAGWCWFQPYQELNSKLGEIKFNGWPTTASEVNVFYKVPDGVVDRTPEWTTAVDAVGAANLMLAGKDLPVFGNNSDPIPPPGEPWKDLEACRKLIQSHQREIDFIRKAASVQGQVRFPVDFSAGIATLLPQAQNSRIAARLLQLDAHVSVHDGDFHRAHQDIMDILSLSNALCGEPCLISQLVRLSIFTVGETTAEAIMPFCDWSEAELLSLQKVVHAAHLESEMQNALVGDTAIALTTLGTLPNRVLHPLNKSKMIDFMNESRVALTRPWPEPLARQAEAGERFRELSQHKWKKRIYVYMLLLAPATDQVLKINCRVVARQRCFILGLAAYRHHLKHGLLPKSLVDLDPSLVPEDSPLKDLIPDPFDGKPLRVRSDETGLLIYSVFENLVDDGGDVTLNNLKPQPGDLGFQVTIP